MQSTRSGAPVNEDDASSHGENLEERTRRLNSHLQRLIEGVSGLLAGSGELLLRLQQLLGGSRPADGGSDEPRGPNGSAPTDRQQE